MMNCLPSDKLLRRGENLERTQHLVLSIWKRHLTPCQQNLSNLHPSHDCVCRMNLEKTEVMWIGEQEVDLHVDVDGKTTD